MCEKIQTIVCIGMACHSQHVTSENWHKFTCHKILALEETGFQLEEHGELFPREFFGGPSTTAMDLINHPKRANPNDYATTRYGIVIRLNLKAPIIDHALIMATNGKVHAKFKPKFKM